MKRKAFTVLPDFTGSISALSRAIASAMLCALRARLCPEI